MNSLFDKLTELLGKYKTVILMSHQGPDLDAIGSSMGLSVILTKMEKDSYIFLSSKKKDAYNNSVMQALKKVDNVDYIYPGDYKDIIDEETVLIILDVHQLARLEYPDILDDVKNVIVLDHHIKGNDYIKNTELFYIDSTMSSMVELVTNYASYANVKLETVIASIMLAGLEVDTNGFNLKTDEQTFEAAAILASMGADNVLKQELLKESKDDYLRRADFVKESYIVNKNIAMCMLSTTSCTKETLADIAEELLKLEYVEASFAIGKLDDDRVGVSARSVGNMNVCEVMKKMGGGGHMTNAATQIEETTVKQVEKTIRKVLGEI